MEDNNRLIYRARAKQQDLRRKVLLKNFLKEQMTHIPLPNATRSSETPLEIPEPEASLDITLNNVDVTNNENQNISSNRLHDCDPSTSASNEMDHIKLIDNSTLTTFDNSIKKQSTFMKFLGFRKSRHLRPRGISKAKTAFKSSKHAARSNLMRSQHRLTADEVKNLKDSSKGGKLSLLNMFKSKRKSLKRAENCDAYKGFRYFLRKPEKNSTLTNSQSCQTDCSWIQDNHIDIQESNRQLVEENRLLSESLSMFITDTSLTISSLRKSTRTGDSDCLSQYENNFDYPPSHSSERSSIKRSSSLQERSVRRSSRCCQRTSSMRDQLARYYQHPSQSGVLKASENKEPMVLRSIHVNKPLRHIIRRQSMPPRPERETGRPILRRWSMSIKDPSQRALTVERRYDPLTRRWVFRNPQREGYVRREENRNEHFSKHLSDYH